MINYAHVKWFTDIAPVKETLDNVLSPVFAGTALAVALLLAALTQLLPSIMKVSALGKLDQGAEKLRPWSFSILQYGTAAALLWAFWRGACSLPNSPLPKGR